jgi:hypothetical protein
MNPEVYLMMAFYGISIAAGFFFGKKVLNMVREHLDHMRLQTKILTEMSKGVQEWKKWDKKHHMEEVHTAKQVKKLLEVIEQ